MKRLCRGLCSLHLHNTTLPTTIRHRCCQSPADCCLDLHPMLPAYHCPSSHNHMVTLASGTLHLHTATSTRHAQQQCCCHQAQCCCHAGTQKTALPSIRLNGVPAGCCCFCCPNVKMVIRPPILPSSITCCSAPLTTWPCGVNTQTAQQAVSTAGKQHSGTAAHRE